MTYDHLHNYMNRDGEITTLDGKHMSGKRNMKPGIYRDFPIDQYYADPCPAPSLSQSIAKILLDQSPAHAALAHPRLHNGADEPDSYRKDLAIGSAAHQLMIGRGKDLAIGMFDSWRTNAAKEFREQAEEEGKTAILREHYEEAFRMVAAGREQINAIGWSDAFRTGYGETCLIWDEYDIWFRTLVDWENHNASYDYKTGAASFAPHDIAYKIERDGWHIQAAMHERGWNMLDPENAGRRKFRFVAQENYPPYALVAVELTEHWLTMGRKALDMAIPIWRQCVANDQWPAYPPQVVRPEFPSFRETRFLDRELAAGQTIIDAG